MLPEYFETNMHHLENDIRKTNCSHKIESDGQLGYLVFLGSRWARLPTRVSFDFYTKANIHIFGTHVCVSHSATIPDHVAHDQICTILIFCTTHTVPNLNLHHLNTHEHLMSKALGHPDFSQEEYQCSNSKKWKTTKQSRTTITPHRRTYNHLGICPNLHSFTHYFSGHFGPPHLPWPLQSFHSPSKKPLQLYRPSRHLVRQCSYLY